MKTSLKSLNKYRLSFFLVGLIVALSFSLVAFSYRTEVSRPTEEWIEGLAQEPGIYTPAVRTMPELPKAVTTTTSPAVEPTPVAGPEPIKPSVGPIGGLDSLDPVGLEPGDEMDISIYNGHAIERFPVFAGCEALSTEDERKKCLHKGLAKHVAKEFKMPRSWADFPVNDKVFVRFVVEKDGSVSQVQVIRGLGGELDEEVMRVVRSLPQLEPATVNGLPVRMYMELPIRIQN